MASRKVLQSLRKYSGGPSGSATTTSSPRRQQDELPDRGSDERPPPSSRSVEPPQIRQFQYSESPGPMITTPSPPVMVSELPTISETTPRILPRRDLADSPTLGTKPQEEDIEMPEYSNPPVQRAQFLGADSTLKPKPPNALIQDVERVRRGVTAPASTQSQENEARYQVDITPPIRRRTPPPRIQIDSSDVYPEELQPRPTVINNSTWQTPAAGLMPPVSNVPMSSPGASTPSYAVRRPTCSLNVVCYRSGADGCVLRQLQTVLSHRFHDEQAFRKSIMRNPHLIYSDQQFFEKLKHIYTYEMCGFWRRFISLKTLRGLRVLSYTPVTRPTPVPFDDFVLQEMLYAYQNPSKIKTETDWIEWVFRLRREDKRHALELVEGWNSRRIAVMATIPWLFSCLVGIIYAGVTKDAQTAFTVASFILTSSTIILALLAVISGIESSGRSNYY